MKHVVVIDYEIGNVFSVCRALETTGARVTLSNDAKTIENADYLVLPGVGSFPDGMKLLTEKNFLSSIKKFVQTQRPFLGICLGMQLMMDWGEEFTQTEGLGLVSGHVKKIPNLTSNGQMLRIPHIGWSPLSPLEVEWDNTLFSETKKGESVYFVHSFHAVLDNAKDVLAVADYGGNKITAAIQSENIYGCQFHPERSGTAGLNILKMFINT